jgi:response regulator RpfG family c-di-GMP phosphodiesterase
VEQRDFWGILERLQQHEMDFRKACITLRCMALGTKNRQQQTADLCKQHLRENHMRQLGLVEEFIQEIEGTGKNHDVGKWGQYADASWKNDEMLKRLDAAFEKWLNP